MLGDCKLFFARLDFPRGCGLFPYSLPLSLVSRLCIQARAGQPARCSSGVGWGQKGIQPRKKLPSSIIGGVATWRGKLKKSQRGAFRISGLSFGAPLTDRQTGPLVVGSTEGPAPLSGELVPLWCWTLGAAKKGTL